MPSAEEVIIRQPRSEELQLVRDLRYEVLDQDKGLPRKTTSNIDDEAANIHMAAFVDSMLVCSVRIDLVNDRPHMYIVRRMATKVTYRDRGIGASVLKAAEATAISRGARQFTLNAREEAVGFYKRAGYELTGKTIVHHGDVNVAMTKQVK